MQRSLAEIVSQFLLKMAKCLYKDRRVLENLSTITVPCGTTARACLSLGRRVQYMSIAGNFQRLPHRRCGPSQLFGGFCIGWATTEG